MCYRLLAQNLGPKKMEDGEDDESWNPEPLQFFMSFFTGRTNISLDIFARGLADYL